MSSSDFYKHAPDEDAPKKKSKIHKKTADLIAKLTEIHQSSIRAVNERDFDINSPLWEHYRLLSSIELETPGLENEFEAAGIESATRSATLPEYLQFLDSLTQLHHDLKMQCEDRNLKLEASDGKARLFAVVSLSGTTPGVQRQIMCTLDFRLIDDQWMVTQIWSMNGVDLLNLDGM